MARDDKRRATDPSFHATGDAPTGKRFDDDEIAVNYYKVLGVDSYATRAEISSAFRSLSLTCHPDKLSDLEEKHKEAYMAAFELIRKAYETLKDNTRRRMYDFQRDMAQAAAALQGWNVGSSGSLDLPLAFKRLLARLKAKGSTLDVRVRCRLEKFVHGGLKVVEQERARIRVSVRQTYLVEVDRGASEGFACKFREAGDWHAEARPDSINFIVTSKRHGTVLRSRDDLVLRQAVEVDPSGGSFFLGTDTVRGHHALVWGDNPLTCITGGRPRTCSVCLRGAGVMPSGSMRFTCLSTLAEASVPSGWEQAWNEELQCVRYYSEDTGRISLQMPRHEPEGEQHAPAADIRVGEKPGGALSAKEHPGLARRTWAEWRDTSVVMMPIHGPITVQTSPPCTLTFYATSPRPDDADRAFMRLPSLLAVVVSSPSCSHRMKTSAWQDLKAQLVPILPIWGALLAAARGVVPKPVAAEPRATTAVGRVWTRRNRWSRLPRESEPAEGASPHMPWARLGDDAFQHGDYFQAAGYYNAHLGERSGANYDDNSVSVLCGLSDSLRAMESVEGSHVVWEAAAHAQRAVDLRPQWARAWICVADAVAKCGKPPEAVHAYRRAVEAEATHAHIELLTAYVRRVQTPSVGQAEALHAAGNMEMKRASHTSAIASYTHALALLPSDLQNAQALDYYMPWRAVLHANRSAAFCQLARWSSAVADARVAVEMQQNDAKARARLGTALLGSALYEDAYAQFVQAEQLLQFGPAGQLGIVRRGTDTCLSMIALWKSLKAQRRLADRFDMDRHRPPGSCKVYALCNAHDDELASLAHKVDDRFHEDILIVAGNACATKVGFRRAFKALLKKFRRVFWIPGPREMRIYPSEAKSFPDSLSKLLGIMDLCDELGVDVFPAAVCSGVFVVPLFSWDATGEGADLHSKWPMDPRTELWKYMLTLNKKIVEHTYGGFVITASHFPPRLGLARPSAAGQRGVPACEELDAQVRAVRSRVHLFWSSSQASRDTVDGVVYMSSCFKSEPRSLSDGQEDQWEVEQDRAGRARWKLRGMQEPRSLSGGQHSQWEIERDRAGRARSKPRDMQVKDIMDPASEGPVRAMFYLVGDWDTWEDFVPFSLQEQRIDGHVYTARQYFESEGEYNFLISWTQDLDKCFYPCRCDIRGPARQPAEYWTVALKKPFHWLEVRWEVSPDFRDRDPNDSSNISWRVGISVALGPGLADRLAEMWDSAPLGAFIGWDTMLSTMCIEYQHGHGRLSEEAWRTGGELASTTLQACLEDTPGPPGFTQAVIQAMIRRRD